MHTNNLKYFSFQLHRVFHQEGDRTAWKKHGWSQTLCWTPPSTWTPASTCPMMTHTTSQPHPLPRHRLKWNQLQAIPRLKWNQPQANPPLNLNQPQAKSRLKWDWLRRKGSNHLHQCGAHVVPSAVGSALTTFQMTGGRRYGGSIGTWRTQNGEPGCSIQSPYWRRRESVLQAVDVAGRSATGYKISEESQDVSARCSSCQHWDTIQKNDSLVMTMMGKESSKPLAPPQDQRGRQAAANKLDTQPLLDHIESFHPTVSHYRR